MEGGAPRSGWKLTFHGPFTVVSVGFGFGGTVREVSWLGLRKTTKTVPQGSSFSGTVVRPSAIL